MGKLTPPPRQGAQLRHPNPEEAIALTILASAGLEEALQERSVARVSQRA